MKKLEERKDSLPCGESYRLTLLIGAAREQYKKGIIIETAANLLKWL